MRDDGGGGSPIRSASLSVEDDKECVIPVKTGIQTGLDPQSEALRFRLRMTRGLSVEDDKGGSRLRITKGWNEILCKLRKL